MLDFMKTILSAVKYYIDKIAENIDGKIPTKNSQLENDTNFATKEYVDIKMSDIPEAQNDVLVYSEQELTDEQKTQARKNLGLYYKEANVSKELNETDVVISYNRYSDTYFAEVPFDKSEPLAINTKYSLVVKFGSELLEGIVYIDDNGNHIVENMNGIRMNDVNLIIDGNDLGITSETTVKVSATISDNTVVYLEEEYIPDTISRTDHTHNYDDIYAKLNHAHSWNDLEDKPFGEVENVIASASDSIECEYFKDPDAAVAEDLLICDPTLLEYGKEYTVECVVDGQKYTFTLIRESKGDYDTYVTNTYHFHVNDRTGTLAVELMCDYFGIYETKYVDLSVRILDMVTVQLPEEYIPDTIARIEDVNNIVGSIEFPEVPEQVNADYMESDKTSKAFIKNRPGYKEINPDIYSKVETLNVGNYCLVDFNIVTGNYTNYLTYEDLSKEYSRTYDYYMNYMLGTSTLKKRIGKYIKDLDGTNCYCTVSSNPVSYTELYIVHNRELLSDDLKTKILNDGIWLVVTGEEAYINLSNFEFIEYAYTKFDENLLPKTVVFQRDLAEYVSEDKFNESITGLENELTSYTDTKIADLVNSAPETLDTLGELATAFEENKEVVETLDSAITNKVDKTVFEENITNLQEAIDEFEEITSAEVIAMFAAE